MSEAGASGKKTSKGKSKGTSWSKIQPDRLKFGTKAVRASRPFPDENSTLEKLTTETTKLLQLPIPTEEGYCQSKAAQSVDGILSELWPVADFLSEVHQTHAVRSIDPKQSGVTSQFEAKAQREYLGKLEAETEDPLGLNPFIYLKPEGPSLVSRNLTQLSEESGRQYSAQYPSSRCMTKRLMEYGASCIKAFNSAWEQTLAATRDVLELGDAATLQDCKEAYQRNKQRYGRVGIAELEGTSKTLTDTVPQYRDLYETVFDPVISTVENECRSLLESSRGADPDMSEANTLTLHAQTDLLDCQGTYEKTKDSLLPPESRGMTTSFGIRRPDLLHPRTRLQALNEINDLASEMSYTPSFQPATANSAALAMSQLLRLRKDMEAVKTDYVRDLQETHRTQKDIGSTTGMSVSEAERAFVEDPSKKGE
ncbi:hypothetical protein IAT40_007741 [Kwoniella sp. CBS 6097]